MKLLHLMLPICISVTMLLSTGCSQIDTLMRAQEIDSEIKHDRIDFYQKLSDAYFILGYEYYSLAREAEENNRDELAKRYTSKAKIYNLFYRDANRTTEQLRADLYDEEEDSSLDDIAGPSDDSLALDSEF